MNTVVQESQGIMGNKAIGDDLKMEEYKFCWHMDKK
jgi:hypothetical protein